MTSRTVIREHTPASRCNSRKTIRLPSRWKMRPDSPALRAEQFLVPKQVKSLDLLDGTTDSPWEIPQKSRGTLMSLQEYEIPRGNPNKLKIKHNSPALGPEQFPFPHHTRQVAWLPFGTYRNSLGHTSSVYRNTNFSTETSGKFHAPHIVSRGELIPRILLNS